MKIENILKKINSDVRILGYVPMGMITLTPRFIKQGKDTVLEIFYMLSDNSQGRYTVYPARYRVLYDYKNSIPVLMERLNKELDYSAPLGSYIKLIEDSGIPVDAAQKYAEACNKALESVDLTETQIDSLRELWETIIPEKIKATL